MDKSVNDEYGKKHRWYKALLKEEEPPPDEEIEHEAPICNGCGYVVCECGDEEYDDDGCQCPECV